MEINKRNFVFEWADNVLILGQRLGEWCGHGPVLEQDIALINTSLDLIGEARNLYQYLSMHEGVRMTLLWFDTKTNTEIYC